MKPFKQWEKLRGLILMDNYRLYLREMLEADNVDAGDMMKDTLGYWEFARREYEEDQRRGEKAEEVVYKESPPRR